MQIFFSELGKFRERLFHGVLDEELPAAWLRGVDGGFPKVPPFQPSAYHAAPLIEGPFAA